MAVALSALESARGLVRASAVIYKGETTPLGSLLASSTATGSQEADDIRRLVADIWRKLVVVFEQRIK